MGVNGSVDISNDLFVGSTSGNLYLKNSAQLIGEDGSSNQTLVFNGATKPTMTVGITSGINTPIVGGITDAVDQGVFQTDYINAGVASNVNAQGFIITNAVAGETISLSQLLFLSSSNKWFLADADSVNTSTPLLGIAVSNAADPDDAISVLLEGHYSVTTSYPYHDELATATIGLPLYVSTTAGNVTETAPTATGDVVRAVGHNLYYEQDSGRDTVDIVVVRFKPDNTWIEL